MRSAWSSDTAGLHLHTSGFGPEAETQQKKTGQTLMWVEGSSSSKSLKLFLSELQKHAEVITLKRLRTDDVSCVSSSDSPLKGRVSVSRVGVLGAASSFRHARSKAKKL